MTRQRFTGWVVLGVALWVWGVATPAHAIWMDLTPEQAKRAEKVGGFQSSAADPTKFMQKWVVNLGEGKGAALQPWEVEDALARARGKLVFSVTTFGDTDDFSDGLRGWLVVGGKKVQNTHWQNGAATSSGGGKFVADSTFWFLSEGIAPEAQVELLIEHEQTGQTWRFPFDLSKMI